VLVLMLVLALALALVLSAGYLCHVPVQSR
jgi:hypothetical protein